MNKPLKIKKVFDCTQCKSYQVCKLRTSIGIAINNAFSFELEKPIEGYRNVVMNCNVFVQREGIGLPYPKEATTWDD